MSWIRSLSIVCCLVLAVPLSAQQPVAVTSDVACAACRIDLEHIVTIGDVDGPGALEDFPRAITRDSRGRFYVVPAQLGSLVTVFDSRGQFLTRIGRQGKGPNEYSFVSEVVVSQGDTIHIMDASNARISILDSHYGLVRTLPLNMVAERALRVRGGSYVIASTVLTAASAGFPLHHVAQDGALVRSFGARNPSVHSNSDPNFRKRIYPAGGGGVWLASENAYRFERWSTDGQLLGIVQRVTPRFRTWTTRRQTSPSRPPLPRLRDFVQDRDGNIITLIAVPRDDYASSLRKLTVEGREVWTGSDGPRSLYKVLIEVIDPARGVLLAAREVPMAFSDFLPGGTVVEWAPRGAAPVLHVWRVRFVHADRR